MSCVRVCIYTFALHQTKARRRLTPLTSHYPPSVSSVSCSSVIHLVDSLPDGWQTTPDKRKVRQAIELTERQFVIHRLNASSLWPTRSGCGSARFQHLTTSNTGGSISECVTSWSILACFLYVYAPEYTHAFLRCQDMHISRGQVFLEAETCSRRMNKQASSLPVRPLHIVRSCISICAHEYMRTYVRCVESNTLLTRWVRRKPRAY